MEKEIVANYVRRIKKLFVIFSCVMIPAIMVCLIFAFGGSIAFCIIAPVLIVVYLILYGVYALYVSMGLVVGYEVTDLVVHIKTKRKTFTYDARMGCVAIKVKKGKFVGTFRTQDSEDKFVFLRRVPFTKRYEVAFTEDDMRRIFPAFEEEGED